MFEEAEGDPARIAFLRKAIGDAHRDGRALEALT